MERSVQFLQIDGSVGGGQVLRTALSLSMITGVPFRITGIRGKRTRPGLLRQHLTAVQAAARISGAQTSGATLNSVELEFRPGKIVGGDYSFAIGTAGSTTLVMQTLIPALLRADAPSTLSISGGTHNPAAPPFEFIERAWLPLLHRMGAHMEIRLVRHGFAPAGGGLIKVRIWPSALMPLHLDQRGECLATRAYAVVSATPVSLASRALDRVASRLKLDRRLMHIHEASESGGPGSVLFVECEHAGGTEVFSSAVGAGSRPEEAADALIEDHALWVDSSAAVGHRLADQLLVPMALAGGGSFTTDRLSGHLQSNAQVIQRFLPVCITMQQNIGHVAVSLVSAE
jgi:RNA 3'-terminal phosphate cyclase (ATP)